MINAQVQVADPRHMAIKVRWDVQLRLMVTALISKNEERMEGCRTRILSIAAEAERLGMPTLATPDPRIKEDTVFEGLEELITPKKVNGANGKAVVPAVGQSGGSNLHGRVDSVRGMITIPKSQLKDDGPPRRELVLGKKQVVVTTEAVETVTDTNPPSNNHPGTKAQALKAIQAAKKKSGKDDPVQIAPKKSKDAPKVVAACICGCGGETTSKFIPGHDAKLKSLLIKIERGVEALDALPEIARPYVTFKKGVLETQDIGGKAVKVQLYVLAKTPVRVPGRSDIEFVENR